ncbi:MAG: DUF2290 domain-containing protein [Flavobacteriales bacterium]|nr:DUF2290 domain-containing protein [Flavobacteriales bacterium]
MKVDKLLVKQIQSLTTKLIESSFQIEYNWVSSKNGIITWDNCRDISFSLKKLPYADMYGECLKERAFNLMLLDGALIQLMYECKNDKIIKHRLAFYPNPDVERYQDDPENFEHNHFGNELFSEVYEKRAIVFPIRFDFDADEKKYKEHDHTYSHLTLGNYTNCRIPVSKPITPNRFLLFILRNFYFDKFKEHYVNDDFSCNFKHDNLLSLSEEKSLFLSYS